MRDLLTGVPAVLLSLEDYRADFKEEGRRSTDVWKLERQQTFREPGWASWEALDRGDWQAAMRLLNETKEEIKAVVINEPFQLNRVRVVEFPLSPYLLWELHVLEIRKDAGEDARIVQVDDLRSMETDEPLPELVIMNNDVMYEVLYDHSRALAGANKITDRVLIEEIGRRLRKLHRSGLDVVKFVAEYMQDDVDLPIATRSF